MLTPHAEYSPCHSAHAKVVVDVLCSMKYDSSKRKRVPDFLTLLPMLPPGGFPQQPSSMRTWKIIVISHDAKEKPAAVAVTGEQYVGS